MEYLVIWMAFIFIFFLIGIAIMRWAFRVNHIIERLDKIAALLERKPAE